MTINFWLGAALIVIGITVFAYLFEVVRAILDGRIRLHRHRP